MKIDLQNKNILVTGASRGIGAAIAKELGTSGARVAIHYNKEKETAEDVAQSSGNGSKIFKPDKIFGKKVVYFTRTFKNDAFLRCCLSFFD